jgi:hypothetical protein
MPKRTEEDYEKPRYQDMPCPGRGSNRAPAECNFKALPEVSEAACVVMDFRAKCPVIFCGCNRSWNVLTAFSHLYQIPWSVYLSVLHAFRRMYGASFIGVLRLWTAGSAEPELLSRYRGFCHVVQNMRHLCHFIEDIQCFCLFVWDIQPFFLFLRHIQFPVF